MEISFTELYDNSTNWRSLVDFLNKKDFEITVLRANRSLSGAKEAGRYEATIYCVNKFGTSDIVWDLDPEDVSEVSSSKSIFIKGRCRI